MNNTSEDVFNDVDGNAGIAVKLRANEDSNGNVYYTGKLQIPGVLNFDNGASFMVFVSEEGAEEMHLRSMPKNKLERIQDQSECTVFHHEDDMLSLSLRSAIDRFENKIYIGEAFGNFKRDLSDGVFFRIFVSKEGFEEIQISSLIDHFEVDKHSGIVVSLKQQTDTHGSNYYTGKLQAPIELDYSKGISFLAFTSIAGEEELHILAMESYVLNKISSKSTMFRTSFGKIKIYLKSFIDSIGEKFYIGEGVGDFESPVNEGLFFTIFNSLSGREEIQISKLDHKLAQKKRKEFEVRQCNQHCYPETIKSA
jgi:hypothetical protein